MPLIEQKPIYLSVQDFKSLTNLSWFKISKLTDIPERTLYRYQQSQNCLTQHRRQIRRLLGLTYKLLVIENQFQESLIVDNLDNCIESLGVIANDSFS